jgi:hypothetical protein
VGAVAPPAWRTGNFAPTVTSAENFGAAHDPLALAMLTADYAEIMRLLAATDDAITEERRGVARTSAIDAIERYLALEEEVLLPALQRSEELAAVRKSSIDWHVELRRAVAAARATDVHYPDAESTLRGLRETFARYHHDERDRHFPQIRQCMADWLPALALELEEARERLRGAYGV